MRSKTLLLTAAAFAALAGAATAQTANNPGTQGDVDTIIVTADPLGRSANEVISNVALLRGDALVQRREGTLGDTLNGLPGVNSDTFGGGSSRPVIRGQTAPRVKALSNGSAILDASAVSPDHAVTGEPLLLEGLEILRGPSALLYGGGAIGGAVNLIDKKVPTRIPVNGGEGVAEVRFGTNDDEKAGVAGMTVGAGHFAVRVEVAGRDVEDYEVPDWSAKRLAGSANSSRTATLGASWIGERGYLGAAFTEQNSNYGLPGHSHEYESCHPHGSAIHCGSHDDHDHDHDHEEEEAPPTVDLVSRRIDLRGEMRNPFAGVEMIRFRGGHTDYQHEELDEGVVSTTFTNKGYDARLEVQHTPIGGLKGVAGVQISKSDFAAVGVESFLVPTDTKTQALFLMETFEAGQWDFEGAVRQEWQKTTTGGALPAARYPNRDFAPLSVSAGAHWHPAPDYAVSLSLARSQRAPNIQELYARGVHLATNTYDLGAADLKKETVLSAELGVKKTAGNTQFSVSAYRYAYDGYIFSDTLDMFEDFRLIRYTQDDATFTGLEGEITQRINGALSVTGFGDYVRAKTDDDGNLPRIPAGRLGARANVDLGPWSGSLEYIRVFDQNRIASFETKTDGYNMLNATVAYDFRVGPAATQIYLRGSNLLDELAFNHASFIADLAPLRGQKIVMGIRTRF